MNLAVSDLPGPLSLLRPRPRAESRAALPYSGMMDISTFKKHYIATWLYFHMEAIDFVVLVSARCGIAVSQGMMRVPGLQGRQVLFPSPRFLALFLSLLPI